MSEKKIQPRKKEAVEVLTSRFKDAKDFFFTDYRGLTVEKITEIRNKLREQNAEYRVVKNNFAKIAFKNNDVEGVDPYLIGPTAVAIADGESGPVAKILMEFEKNDDVPFSIRGGYVDGNCFDVDQVAAFSKLPTKIELISSLMGTMNAPLQYLVYAMNGVTQKLVRVLQAVADKKAEG